MYLSLHPFYVFYLFIQLYLYFLCLGLLLREPKGTLFCVFTFSQEAFWVCCYGNQREAPHFYTFPLSHAPYPFSNHVWSHSSCLQISSLLHPPGFNTPMGCVLFEGTLTIYGFPYGFPFLKPLQKVGVLKETRSELFREADVTRVPSSAGNINPFSKGQSFI